MKLLALLFLILGTLSASADQVVETFSTRTNLETDPGFLPTAVWNQTLGKVHPTLEVKGYGTGGEPAIPFDIGDGSDGVFDSTTYQRFGTIIGHRILLHADHHTLQVSSFYLEPTWILEPQGNTGLVIKSQSSVRIEGEIHCQGDDGENATSTAFGHGGIGRCGGTKGGDGGAAGQPGTDGLPSTDGVTGGFGGGYGVTSAAGGGGGGGRNCGGDSTCTSVLPGDGSNPTTGGAHGTPISDPTFLTEGGGAGGGGGSSGLGGEPGAGGGGGGGSVQIFAGGDFSIGSPLGTSDGYILASGGHGGNGDVEGGPGGGGGGGSVRVFAAGTIYLNNVSIASGASQAKLGAGGTNTSIAHPGNGGDGGDGRSWFTSIHYQSPHTSFYSPGEEFPVQPGDFVNYGTTTQSVTTKVFNLGSSFPKWDGVSLLPSSNDQHVEYRASSDNFISDDSGWTTNLQDVQNKRFLRLRIVLENTNPTAPVMVDSATLNYTPGILNDFSFKGAGCGRISTPTSTPPFGFILTMAFLVLSLLYLKIKARQQKGLPKI